ncbi:MAG TPA: hypothetical protein VLH40_07060 [Atribacteraceae bacterium]|nr:hypothetical protein [Atribacteraceae bacterium]
MLTYVICGYKIVFVIQHVELEADVEIAGYDVVTQKMISITVSDGRVSSIRHVDAPPDSQLTYLCRGFIDLQVNGYRGFDYSREGLTEKDIGQVVWYLAQSGTTRHLATIITSPRERIVANLKTIRNARRNSPLVAWAVPFVHIEGPFISSSDGPRGAHDASFIRDPNYDEFCEWQAASGGIIKIVTLAPERPGAIDFISRVSNEGIIVALGHSEASAEQIREAVAAGARMSTHLGNGSHALLPRLRNYIWEQLAADELTASFICDGFHLPDAVIKVVSRTKPLEKLVMVSDVGALGGCTPGVHYWGSTKVEVHDDGHLSVAGTPYLAGAGHLLNRCIGCFCRATGEGLCRALELCITNPSTLVGLDHTSISLSEGDEVNVVQFTVAAFGIGIDVKQTIGPMGMMYEC